MTHSNDEPRRASGAAPKKKQFHRKSKSGCSHCRIRRVKCDETRPVCLSCLRIGQPGHCQYPSTTAESVTSASQEDDERPQATADHQTTRTFHKKFHKKSRLGCERCKQRRIKCDEAVPSCVNCVRIKSTCVYPTSQRASRANSLTDSPAPGVPAQMHLVQLGDRDTSLALEYFHLYIIPMFQACHPSTLWTSTLGYTIQTDAAIRDIALALGSQQWMVQARRGTPIPRSWISPSQSATFYDQAVRSLRQKLQSTTLADAPMITFCCILCVALECLRGSPKNVVLHLDNAVRILSQTTGSKPILDKDMQDLVCLVQAMCASAWAYCAVPGTTPDYAVRMCSMDLRKLCNLNFPDSGIISSTDVHSIVLELICVLRQLMSPTATASARSAAFEEMYRLQLRTRNVRSRLLYETRDSAARGFLESKLIMTQLFLDSTLTASRNIKVEKQGFGRVLSLLESSLRRWREDSKSAEPYPFTLTSGAIHTIETVLRAKPGKELEDRAKNLLQSCPPREGLWTTEPRAKIWKAFKSRGKLVRLDFDARVPVPFSVFPSSYRNEQTSNTTEVQTNEQLTVQGAGRDRFNQQDSYSQQQNIRITEQNQGGRRGRGRQEEDVNVRVTDTHQTRYREQPYRRYEDTQIDIDNRYYDRQPNDINIDTHIDVAERDYRDRTTPFAQDYCESRGWQDRSNINITDERSKMGYYDEEGQYHSFRSGIRHAAEDILHPIHAAERRFEERVGVDVQEENITVEERERSSGGRRGGFQERTTVRFDSRAQSRNTVTIPCHFIRIGDILILQGRPCQVIRITTSAQTGQYRYLGVDLFTKQLQEESSFMSNPSPSVYVQNMLGPVFKQYRVLDIRREEGLIVAMTETGDVKQGLTVLDQSKLFERIQSSYSGGRGSVRVLVINDGGRELVVDMKVIHGSRL